jgi:hypothetical protein
MRLITLGVGAMESPRYAPAGLLVAVDRARVMIDGGPLSEPKGRLDAWLVTDERAELRSAIRRLATQHGLRPQVVAWRGGGASIVPRRVVHTSHPTFGYLLRTAAGKTAVWAPEFLEFPSWARGADILFADASSWSAPIRFARGVGGHLDVVAIAKAAKRARVKRLVFSHIGRRTIRALDGGRSPPFGEFATDGQEFVLR